MSFDAFKYFAGANKWYNFAAYAAGLSAALFAGQSGWIPNNLGFDFADNAFIYLMLIAIYCKLEAGIIQRNLLINTGLEQLTKRKDD